MRLDENPQRARVTPVHVTGSSPRTVPRSCVRLAMLAGLGCLLARGLPAAPAERHPIAGPGTFELHDGLELSLLAREPDVVDPVGLTIDEDGRVYVVEMRDYPYGIGSAHLAGGTIRLLEDRDGDGRIDHSTLFATNLSFPTSIAPWNGGVIVTAPPEVIFLKDTDGDGKADVREVLLKGFVKGVTDSNVNGLRWGLDNRLHGANGGNGGSIVSTRRPGPPVALRNVDFSFDPATGDFTPTFHTGAGFGLVFDEWGRSFVTYNINHLQHRILPVRYLNRFPGLPPVEAVVSISDHEEMSRIYPVSEPETRVNHPEQSGHFSAAGGLGYLGCGGYPGDLSGSVFVCDVVGNLVHRDVIEPHGPIFVARRSSSELTREFFGSRDPAFRPVGLELGPDGALYLVDMQRDVIEHPDYIPQKVKEKLDLRAGEDRGRVYRITPRGGLPRVAVYPGKSSSAGLVGFLAHSNQWWRTTAQRLLIQRHDRTALPLLRDLARHGGDLGRLHALWTLQGLGQLDESLIRSALASPSAGLRENALQLAESQLAGSSALQQQVLGMAVSAEPRVRFQVALALGTFANAQSRAALRTIFSQDHAERWTRLAVLSSLRDGEDEFLRAVLKDESFRAGREADPSEAIRELADLCGARARAEAGLASLLETLASLAPEPGLQAAVLEGLHSGLIRGETRPAASPRLAAALEALARLDQPGLFAASWQLGRTLGLPESVRQAQAVTRAAEGALDSKRSEQERLADIRVLALGSDTAATPALLALLSGGQPAPVREASLRALSSRRDPSLGRELVMRWRLLAPSARPGVIQLLLQRVPFHEALLDAIEQDRIKVGELNLDLEQRRRLLRKSSPAIMARAAKWVSDEEYSNRKSVVEDWLKKLPPTGDAEKGRAAFEKTCAQCHALGGVGQAVGPDLGALAHRSVEDLLSNILDPNMAINPAYVSFTAETVSGEIETGLLHSESADAVVLLQPMGRKVILSRKDLKRLESSGLSLMPEGLEAGMTPADLRDLIAFLQATR